ncbi:carbohydrate kinase family protein [Limoniibacter endophyticus]|uniref:carbohydrate kinase family protein n=1 Tax=Limoniibacter endophyticus TaxID=1565040 RepID=UPI001FCF11FD|nr:carbohydrate kinase family protein [Limoniibacter endophyticus]
MNPLLLGIGGAHIDRRGRLLDSYIPAASNPGAVTEDIGGGMFNAMRSAVQRGCRGGVLSVRGGDQAGESVAAALADWNISDHSAVFLDRRTASYTAVLDQNGDLLVGLADMAIYDSCFARQLRRRHVVERIEEANSVLVDANLPSPALESVVQQAARNEKPLYLIAISPAKVVRALPYLTAFDGLFLNRCEVAALCPDAPVEAAGTVAALRNVGIRRAVITNGAHPAIVFDAHEIAEIAPAKDATVVDVTGAGDSLAGTAIAGLMRGLSFFRAAREGLAAATITIASDKAVPNLAPEIFAPSLARIGQIRILQNA